MPGDIFELRPGVEIEQKRGGWPRLPLEVVRPCLLSCVSCTQPLERFLPAVHCRLSEISIYVHSSRTFVIKLWSAYPVYILFEYLTATGLKTEVFWDVKPRRLVFIGASKECVGKYKSETLHGLLDSEDGYILFRNVDSYVEAERAWK